MHTCTRAHTHTYTVIVLGFFFFFFLVGTVATGDYCCKTLPQQASHRSFAPPNVNRHVDFPSKQLQKKHIEPEQTRLTKEVTILPNTNDPSQAQKGHPEGLPNPFSTERSFTALTPASDSLPTGLFACSQK